MANPFFATETSRIDPLPHQHLAVYEHMLNQPRLRFLLADDAGAGKTIMAGLYVREMLSRRRIRRILVVPPAGLVGNWQNEMADLFGLEFCVLEGADMRQDNPFAKDIGDRAIVSIDTLRQPQAMERLRETETQPYDLVIFDEAHKLSFQRDDSYREKRTDRYKLAETLAGVPGVEPSWQLPWSAQHVMLLTATPHMGKPFPYFALWRLLLPSIVTTPDALEALPAHRREAHFIRRTKEEMVYLDGRPLYPARVCQTMSYALSQGDASEQELYDLTTAYLREVYNKAKLLNKSAARMVVSVFQRRIASSTYALACSLGRRLAKLEELLKRVQTGRQTDEEFRTWFRKWQREQEREAQDEGDVYEQTTADEADEAALEHAEHTMMSLFVADSTTDLKNERDTVAGLLDLAQRVMAKGEETKFTKLREILTDPKHVHEKLLIFTEHRDTLSFLIQRLEQIGYTGQISQIHGGMHYKERQAQLDRFRLDEDSGGSRLMICTDAAGEGLNMQFCGRMVNYDIPWNPARLEQRMGRIHRYGQKRDRVFIFNLVAAGDSNDDEQKNGTREGKVLRTLLEKLETIRQALNSEKVFDSIGRVMAGVSIKDYMDQLNDPAADPDTVAAKLGGSLTEEQVKAISETERRLYGDGGDVKRELGRLQESTRCEAERRLMPGFVRRFIEHAAPSLGLHVVGDTGRGFTLEAARQGALDWLLPLLEDLGDGDIVPLCCERPQRGDRKLWLHPGEMLFEKICAQVRTELGPQSRRGSILVDPETTEPYLLHMGRTRIIRQPAGADWHEFSHVETLDNRLVAVKQFHNQQMQRVSPQHILCLRGRRSSDGAALPSEAQLLMGQGTALRSQAASYLADDARQRAAALTQDAETRAHEAAGWVKAGFNAERQELAEARKLLRPKVQKGDKGAILEADRIQKRQRSLDERRGRALALLELEPRLIAADPDIDWLGHALVLPSHDPQDLERILHSSEMIAQTHAIAWLEAQGARVTEVHTKERALKAGLAPHPGFDLIATFDDGRRWHIEVKGRMNIGDIELTSNEWSRACNLGDDYWLFVVFHCATDRPHLCRVRNPFHSLLTKATGNVVIDAQTIQHAGQPN